MITRMAAKAAIERAQNELARFVERKLARQDVNIHSFFCFIVLLFFHITLRMELNLTLLSLLNQLSFARIISRSAELMRASLCSRLLDDFKLLEVLA